MKDARGAAVSFKEKHESSAGQYIMLKRVEEGVLVERRNRGSARRAAGYQRC
jgi:hypothetical protein